MKKLLHLQLLPLLSGVQNFSLHLLEGLDKDEYEIHIAFQPGGPLVEEVQKRGYIYHPLKLLKHSISAIDLLAFWEIYLLCKRESFDIVHTNCSKPGLLGRMAACLAATPIIIHSSHGMPFLPDQSRPVRLIFMALEWLSGLFGHHVAYVNHSNRISSIKRGLIAKAKAVTIYNALPPTLETRLKSIASNRQTPDPDCITIGSTLRFSTQKNIINVILAACDACKLEPRLKFIFVGEGEHFALCRAIISSRKLNHRILLPGWDDDISLWLGKMDVFMLYSRWEALPFSIIEANFSGLPVLGSAIPSIMELVSEDTGWLIPLDDHQALVKTLLKIVQNPEQITHKGNKARNRIAGLCSYQDMVAGYESLYHAKGQ